jgi:hypothetical protein
LLMKKRCGERADSRTNITASHHGEEHHGRSLSAIVNGKGNTSPSTQARGRRPRRRAAARQQQAPHIIRRVCRDRALPPPHQPRHCQSPSLHVKLAQNLSYQSTRSIGMQHPRCCRHQIQRFGFSPWSLGRGRGGGISTVPQE